MDWADKIQGGRLSIDEHLRVKDGKAERSIYAIGDCAGIEGRPLPAIAQVSQYLAEEKGGEKFVGTQSWFVYSLGSNLIRFLGNGYYFSKVAEQEGTYLAKVLNEYGVHGPDKLAKFGNFTFKTKGTSIGSSRRISCTLRTGIRGSLISACFN